MFGELGAALSASGPENGRVLLTLLCLVPGIDERPVLAEDLAVDLAKGLRSHVRDDDSIFRIDEQTFAVVASLRSREVDPSTIEDRLAMTVQFVATSKAPEYAVRSGVAFVTELDGTPTPDQVFRQAVLALGS